MAFDDARANNDSIGSFFQPSDGQVVSCSSGTSLNVIHYKLFITIIISKAIIVFIGFLLCMMGVVTQNVVTHKSSEDKQFVTVYWTPPEDFVGSVTFRYIEN